MDLSTISQVVVNGLVSSVTVVLVALGVTIVFGIMHIINFAHGELYMLGSYGAWFFLGELLSKVWGANLVTYFIAMLITMVLVAVLGMLIERGPLRQWHGKLLGSFIISMGFILILQSSALGLFTGFDKRARNPVPGIIEVGGVTLAYNRLMVIIVSIAIIVALYLFMKQAKLGKAMRAVEQDREAAALQGVNYSRTCSLAMGIGCALASAAGSLLGIIFVINPWVGEATVLKAFTTVVLGGMGSFGGTIIAGFIVGYTETLGTMYLGGGDVALMLVFGLMMLVLIIKPSGLFGHG